MKVPKRNTFKYNACKTISYCKTETVEMLFLMETRRE